MDWRSLVVVAAALVPAAGCSRTTPTPPTALSVAVPLRDVTVTEGQSAVFSVEVSPTLPFVVEWRRNGSVVTRSRETTFEITPAAVEDDGIVIGARVVALQGTRRIVADAGSGRLSVTLRPPDRPANFMIVPEGNEGARFTWTDVATNETGYQFVRVVGGQESLPFERDANSTSVSIQAEYLSPGVTETFRMRAFRGAGSRRAESAAVDASVTMPGQGPPMRPLEPQLSVVAIGTVLFTWRDLASNEEGFEVFIALNGTDRLLFRPDPDETEQLITGLTPGVYTFRVRSFRTNGGTRYESLFASATITVPS